MYLYYEHDSLGEWIDSVAAEGQAETEFKTFKDKYLKEYNIKGLVLDKIIDGVSYQCQFYKSIVHVLLLK